MKVLLIGGTGTISTEISKKLIRDGHELWLINRGNRNHELPEGAHTITVDTRARRFPIPTGSIPATRSPARSI